MTALSQANGAIAALGTSLCWSFTPLFFAYSGRRVGSGVVNRSRLVFALVIYAIAHLVLFGHLAPQGVGPSRAGWLAISGLLGLVLGDAALFQSFVLVGPRLSTLTMSTVPIVSSLLAWLFLSETIGGAALLGIALTIAGVTWVVTERTGAREGADPSVYRRGIALGLVGAAGQASGLIAARYGLSGGYPAISASFVRIALAALVLWGISALRGDMGRVVSKWRDGRALAAMMAGALIGPFLGVSLSLFAVQHARVGIASTLMALPPVLLIPIEFVVHGRRTSRRGLIGTAIAFVGVAMIFVVGD
jgi:drug/metabolite transporter (DMT)-like permease